MNQSRAAILFSGQGTLSRKTLTKPEVYTQFRHVLYEIGAPAVQYGLWAHGPRATQRLTRHLPETPEGLSLFFFAASVAHYRTLQKQGIQPSVLLGHGFGEIIALVCAGAFSVQQGAEIVLHRAVALERARTEAAAMVVANTDKSVAKSLVQLADGHPTAVAAENSPTEIVISGTSAGIDRIRSLARDRGIAVTTMKARWALHCRPIMLPAAAELKDRLRHIPFQPLQLPVFSPIFGRYYDDAENVAELIAEHLSRI